MKTKTGESFLDLEEFAGGAFAEKVGEALLQVTENIQNPNTDPLATRGITINIKLKPNKHRNAANATITVQTKLAPTEAIETQMLMGKNMKTGLYEVAEYDPFRGQMTLGDYMSEEEEPQETGKPLDLRNRNKQQEEAEGKIVPLGNKVAQA